MYKKGFLLPYGEHKLKILSGQMLPQPGVITAQGQQVLLDEILGKGFAVLRLHHNPEEAFAALKTDFWERLGARFVCIQPCAHGKERHTINHQELSPDRADELMGGGTHLTVVQANDTSFPDYYRNLFVVVRPDRYILGVFREEKADMFVSAFQQLLRKHI
jgi:3-(3-hydroxy-phenyl)propionate hydroxylase